MTSVEYKTFIERVKTVLRNKRLKKEDTTCIFDEVFKTLSEDEQTYYHYYKLSTFQNTLYESIKVLNSFIFNHIEQS